MWWICGCVCSSLPDAGFCILCVFCVLFCLFFCIIAQSPSQAFMFLKKKTLQKESYCLTCGLRTINDNGLHDSDGVEIQKLYKSKTNESPACARTDGSIRCLLQFNGLDCNNNNKKKSRARRRGGGGVCGWWVGGERETDSLKDTPAPFKL